MSEIVVTTGTDVLVRSDQPSSNREGLKAAIFAGSATKRLLLKMPVVIPEGRVVLSAILSGVASATFPGTGNLTAQALASGWQASKVKWNNKPATTGSDYSTATGVVAAGSRFELDVTDLVQAIANGQANNGWQLTTDVTGGVSVKTFDAGGTPWVLTVEMSDLPSVPSQLQPQGKTSLEKWVCRVDDYDSLAAMQVRVDASKTAPYDWQSAEIATTIPQLDLATAAGDTGYAASFPGLADAASTSWQVRVKTVDGFWSDWSDWVTVSRSTKPTLTVSNPAAGLIYDPTPTVEASLSPAGTTATRWQVTVASAADPTDVLYDSGDDITGATLSHTVPLRWDGRPVIGDDGDYLIVVKAWDSPDRVPTFGDPTYVKVTRTVTLDVDGTVNAPTTLTATQEPGNSPGVRLRWTRGTTPDRFIVRRDGKNVATEDAAVWQVSAGVWEYVDYPAPNTEHTWTVRAVEAGKNSPNSPTATLTPDVKGVWIVNARGVVVIDGVDVAGFRKTRKATTINLAYRGEDVDIITAVGGWSGSFTGSIDNRGGRDVAADRAVLEAMRKHPHEPVNLLWGAEAINAYVRDLSHGPHPEWTARTDKHFVSVEFFETTDDL